jgi:hypothetical protein
MFSYLWKPAPSTFDMSTLETGDILLYHTNFWYSRAIEFFGRSHYSHVAIVLKDPHWLTVHHSSLSEPMKSMKEVDVNGNVQLGAGYYILESALTEENPDPITGKIESGVQIQLLKPIINKYLNEGWGRLYYRKLVIRRDTNFYTMLNQAYKIAEGIKYDIDPVDWIKAMVGDISGPVQRKDRFWCSALVAFVLTYLGVFDSKLPWSLMTPGFLSSSNTNVKLLQGSLTSDVEIV